MSVPGRAFFALPILSAAQAATVFAADAGGGAAASSVLLHRPPHGAGVGLAGLFIFLACMAAVLLAWLRLHRNGQGR